MTAAGLGERTSSITAARSSGHPERTWKRVAPRRVCVEFRNRTWMTEDNQKETLDFLSAHNLPYVCVDEPQGYPNSVPPVLAAFTELLEMSVTRPTNVVSGNASS